MLLHMQSYTYYKVHMPFKYVITYTYPSVLPNRSGKVLLWTFLVISIAVRCGRTIMWRNGRPSFTKHCRPVHLEHGKETAEVNRAVYQAVESKIVSPYARWAEAGNHRSKAGDSARTVMEAVSADAPTASTSGSPPVLEKRHVIRLKDVDNVKAATKDVKPRENVAEIIEEWRTSGEVMSLALVYYNP